MKKVLISLMVVLSMFVFSTAALAERLDIWVYPEGGNIPVESGWVYVNKGNFLHVGVNYIGTGGDDQRTYPLSFWVDDINGKRITNGTANNPYDDKAYRVGVPEGYYKLFMMCGNSGENAKCYANGWIND